jgi:hypothetical protein
VTRAGSVLGYSRIVVANMCASATRSVVELNALADDGWELARLEMTASLAGASAVLAGWGVAGLTGQARRRMEAQEEWLSERARDLGIKAFWMVGGKPRHPSRWHQYVSDKYGRTTGGSFEERIAQVLVEVPIIRPERQRVVEMRIERTPPHLLGRM